MITDVKTLTKQERTDIAEFIYSYQTDVLIKSDAIRLVEVLVKHNLLTGLEGWVEDINNQKEGIADLLYDRLGEKISRDVVKAIMNEYFPQANLK